MRWRCNFCLLPTRRRARKHLPRCGSHYQSSQTLGSDAMNISLPPSTDISQIALYFLSTNAAPKGRNWANWKNEEFDMLIDRIEKSSDQAQILKDTQRAHEIIVDDAPWAFIVHDRNPRAMTKKVKGFTSAQSWFQDFTSVTGVIGSDRDRRFARSQCPNLPATGERGTHGNRA